MGRSIFTSFFGCVSRTAVDELRCNGGRTRGSQAGEGDSLSGTSLERIGAVVKPYAKRQAFGLARRISKGVSAGPATVPWSHSGTASENMLIVPVMIYEQVKLSPMLHKFLLRVY